MLQIPSGKKDVERKLLMKLINTVFFILLSVYCSSLYADKQRLIELNDGSVISGQIVSFSNGTYTINSASLGIIKIEDSTIQAIRSNSEDAKIQTIRSNSNRPISDIAINPTSVSNTDLQSLQNLMMGNPSIMNTILSLQDDPDFQAILQDSDIMAAIMSGNLNALMTNTTFMELLEHQQVKGIIEEVKEAE